ncbi:hypothetical protein BGZ76_009608 [Entomortierella beljakovae]|nr:hypothetical protein BGZ76_009608 [Entomortierella beljakovae]
MDVKDNSVIPVEQVKEVMDIPGNNKNPSQILDEILMKFGLELNLPYQPCGITFHQHIYTHGLSDKYTRLMYDTSYSFSTMTIDYSKLHTKLVLDEIGNLALFKMREVPKRLGRGGCRATAQDLKTHDVIENVSSLELAIIDMWIHYNSDYITELTFVTKVAHKFLPYATKLSKLAVLFMERSDELDYSDLQDAISFIVQNQSTFPWKSPIHVREWDEWPIPMYGDDPIVIDATDHGSYISALKLARDTILEHTKPTIMIYEAVESPLVLRLNDIPNFYNLAQNIMTDNLIELYDNDPFRFDVGEGESMGKFLQRCSNLKKLAITVNHHEAFLWATQQCQPRSGMPLMQLEELEIGWDSVYHASIMALNEAMSVFFMSLKKVTLCTTDNGEYNLGDCFIIPTYAENAWTLRSLQLQHLPSANTIGNFPTLIPYLTHLKINLPTVSSINIGALDNCPNLEELQIEFGRAKYFGRRTQEVEEPVAIPESDVMLDLNWRHLEVEHSLFPLWNLPKLKLLILKSMAAMRFDFASLPLMQRLQTLHLSAVHDSFSNQDIQEYFIRQCKIPQDADSSPAIGNLGPQIGVFGLYSCQEWSLPCLSKIQIEGPPCVAFCLDYLRLFPSLKSLTLMQHTANPIELHRNLNLGLMNLNPVYPTSEAYVLNDKPFLESQLEEFTLMGKWIISQYALTSLLSVYAPFMRKFFANRLQCSETGNIYGLLKAFNQAGEINKVYCDRVSLGNESLVQTPSANNASLPGQQLMSVTLNGNQMIQLKTLGFQE